MLLNQGGGGTLNGISFSFSFSHVCQTGHCTLLALAFVKSEAGHSKKESKQLPDSCSEADDNFDSVWE